MEVTQWDFQNKGTRTNPARLSFVLKVPLCNLRSSVIYSVPCDQIVQRAYSNHHISIKNCQVIQKSFIDRIFNAGFTLGSESVNTPMMQNFGFVRVLMAFDWFTRIYRRFWQNNFCSKIEIWRAK